jgi:tight adherence protein B
MGALVGLGFGVGALLIWSAFFLPRRPRQTDRRPRRGEQLLARAGLGEVSPTSLAALCAVLALVAFVAVQALTRAAPVALCFALMAGYLPVGVLKARARKRQAEFAEVWPDAVDNLASGVRAGLSLPEAVASLATNGPEPLRPDFDQFALDYQVTGRFDESLELLTQRLADPVGDRVVEGLRIARVVGGGELGRLLRNLSGYLRDEARTRSELESRQAWTVNGARLAVAAPWVVLLFMSFQGEVIRRYASVGGALVLGVGGAVCVLAYAVMMRIGRLPVEQRILR